MVKNKYEVTWSRAALRILFSYHDIDHDDVYHKSLLLLKEEPWSAADKIADYAGYSYNGLCLKLIRNVVVVYAVSKNKVRIRAVHHGRTGMTAEVLYGIDPDDNEA